MFFRANCRTRRYIRRVLRFPPLTLLVRTCLIAFLVAYVALLVAVNWLGQADLVRYLALSSGEEMGYNDWDGDHFVTTSKCSTKAYQEAGITNPKEEISMMEVHDCFSITELVTMEDLHLSDRGEAWRDVMDGAFDRDGKIPCQVDGGLKCFGHPIGASGLRMLYEMYLQFQGRAGERQLEDPRFGLTHNLGGFPAMNVCSISIVGRYEE